MVMFTSNVVVDSPFKEEKNSSSKTIKHSFGYIKQALKQEENVSVAV